MAKAIFETGGTTDPCVLTWRATERGYGRCWVKRFDKRIRRAHVLAWVDAHGCLPPEDKPCVLHRCDNPPCVRPSHLFVGTVGDNNRDRGEKKRSANAKKTHCSTCGAPYDEINTSHGVDGRRSCRACSRRRSAEYRARTKEEEMNLTWQQLSATPIKYESALERSGSLPTAPRCRTTSARTVPTRTSTLRSSRSGSPLMEASWTYSATADGVQVAERLRLESGSSSPT